MFEENLRKSWVPCTCALLSLLLSGCGDGEQNEPPPPPVPSQESAAGGGTAETAKPDLSGDQADSAPVQGPSAGGEVRPEPPEQELPPSDFEVCLSRARAGNALAQYTLGLIYLQGRREVGRDLARALSWLSRSARAGYVEAQTWMGNFYAAGKGGPRDYAEALHWFTLAAAQGDPDAAFNLGLLYEGGHGVERNRREALKWFWIAADGGSAGALYHLGLFYRDGANSGAKPGLARRFLSRASRAGFPEAMYLFATEYAEGEECPDLLRAAAERGDAEMKMKVGLAFFNGKKVPRSIEEAFSWFKASGEAGNADGYSMLGILYKRGIGVAADPVEAEKWLKKGAEAGSRRAGKELSGDR